MIKEHWTGYARAGEPVARGKFSLARGIHCCHIFFTPFPDHFPYIVKNVCIYTYLSE